ncbi:hypothetical protein MLD38_005731 [Melastoma candidum]|uniref:Uncharacterized protein n=1 Tax=Melastoma candidum TaxID=119954 RepID=A0ACB9RP98_9MYRT|nr:hypothetical protein MLD38_005731 [Melastoma candidum]
MIYKQAGRGDGVEPRDELQWTSLVLCQPRGQPQRKLLYRVTTPSTIVQVANDIVAPNSIAYLMHGLITGKSTVEMIKTDDHFPQLTANKQPMDVLGCARVHLGSPCGRLCWTIDFVLISACLVLLMLCA